jgi:2-keto-4-pentenoate hydratase
MTRLDRAALQVASDLLLDAWADGRRIVELPADVRPITRAEGYAIQAEVVRRTARPLFGWKIAATSTAGQQHIRVDGPLAGRLLAERVLADGATVNLAHSLMRCVEVEFAFRMGRDLPPREPAWTVDEVMAAVAGLHPAIELPDSRYTDFTAVGAPELIADDACADWFLLGEAAPAGWQTLDLAEHPVAAVKKRRRRAARAWRQRPGGSARRADLARQRAVLLGDDAADRRDRDHGDVPGAGGGASGRRGPRGPGRARTAVGPLQLNTLMARAGTRPT